VVVLSNQAGDANGVAADYGFCLDLDWPRLRQIGAGGWRDRRDKVPAARKGNQPATPLSAEGRKNP
jgi:hypothetical protein